MKKSKIEWTDVVWNPVTGCDPVSPGCCNCYAARQAKRFAGRFGYPRDDPFAVTLHPDRLAEPLRWKRPRIVFVCSMGDLFHEAVSYAFLRKVFEVIESAKQHTFLVLTKRVKRFFDFRYNGTRGKVKPNLWIGVTAENQATAEERIPLLLRIPAALHFVSCEPMLGPIDLTNVCGINAFCGTGYSGVTSWRSCPVKSLCVRWVIAGGESGPRARPMHPDWARAVRNQCEAHETPFFFKQWGDWVGGHPAGPGWAQYHNGALVSGIQYRFDCRAVAMRCGKRLAGNLLDGQEWKQTP